MLAKVFPIKLKAGAQAKAEAIVQQFAPGVPPDAARPLDFEATRSCAMTPYREKGSTMRSGTKRGAQLLAVTVLLTLLSANGSASAGTAPDEEGAAGAPGSTARTVALITTGRAVSSQNMGGIRI